VKHSTERILTTHCGSLPRPADLLAVMRDKENGRPYNKAAFDSRAREAVQDAVRHQCDIGVDIPSDGEQSKSGFGSYQAERFAGFTPADPQPPPPGRHSPEIDEYSDYYARYFATAMEGARLAPVLTMICTAPVKYVGQAVLRQDIANLKAGLAGQRYEEAFVPSADPLTFADRQNEYYRTQEEYVEACIEATREEYKAIVEAGFILQVDDPALGTSLWGFRDLPDDERRKKVDERVEQINHALRGLPEDRIRYHSCYSINQGPSVYNMQLREWAGIALRVNAQAFAFEVMNPRHMHDYHTFEGLKLPEGQIIVPGMISHGHNWVEHPQLIAELTVNYAKLVGRENVHIGADCGFASQAGAHEVDPKVVWAKFQALVEGARLATKQLWGRA